MLCPFWDSGIPFLCSQPFLGMEPPGAGKILPPPGNFLQGSKHSTGMNTDVLGTCGKGLQRKAQRKGISSACPLCWKCCCSLIPCLPMSMSFLKLPHFSRIPGSAQSKNLLLSVTYRSGPSRITPALERLGWKEFFEQALEGQIPICPCTLPACPSISILGTEWKRSPVSCNYRGLWDNNSPARQLKTGPG